MSLNSVKSLFTSFHSEYKRAGSCARPPFRLHFLRKFETVAKFMFCLCRSVVDHPPASPPPPTTQPGADHCARPPSRQQCRESDNIRSILFPVTHSPRPTGKWKRLLEAVNGEWKQRGRWVTVDISLCVCVCVQHTYSMHSREFRKPGRYIL